MLLAQFFLAVRQNNLYQITTLDLDGWECFAVIPELILPSNSGHAAK